MNIKAITAITIALTLGSVQAGEQGGWLSSIFKSIFSNNSVQSSQSSKHETKLAYAAPMGLAAVVLGWLGYKTYKKHEAQVPAKKQDLYNKVLDLKKRKRELLKTEIAPLNNKLSELKSEADNLRNRLLKEAVQQKIVQPRAVIDTFIEENQDKLVMNRSTEKTFIKFREMESKIRQQEAEIEKTRQQRISPLENKEEALLKQYKRFGVFNSFFSR